MKLPCLPLIQERFVQALLPHLEEPKKYYPEVEMYMFPQTWGSTALGFGGIGGQAMTSAYTTVVTDIYYGWYGVFFNEGLAYLVTNPSDAFFEDLRKGEMASVAKSRRYNRREENDKQ